MGINIIGGLIPIAIAFWQFTRVAVSPIFLVTAVTIAYCYFMVEVANGSTSLKKRESWTIALLVSILTICIAEPTSRMAISYAGITLGSLIGADLLHLKDLRPEQTDYGMSIGGGGSKNGIALSGLYAILTIELWQQVFSLISSS